NLTTAFATNVANITANAATSAFISDGAGGTVTINGPSSAGTDFNFVATNATTLTNTATIDANNTNANSTVELTSQAGGLDVAAAIGNTTTPVGTVTLTSHDNLLSSNITGAVDATNLSLTSTTGGIGGTNLTTPFATSVANITANAATSADISDSASGTVTINGPSSAGTDFNFVATNATTLTNTATIDAGNTNPNSTVELTSQAGGLDVAAAIGNTTTPVGTVTLTSHDNLLSSNITGAVDATNLSLTSTTGGIGGTNLTTPFATSVANITANAATSADISDSASGTVTINGPSSAGTDFNFVATNATTLTNTATIDAGNTNPNSTVELTSQAGGLDVAAAIGNTTTPVGTVSLTSKTNLLSSNITGAVDATNLSLTSTTGGIGGSNLTTAFATNVANVQANAATSAFISDGAAGTVTINGPSSAGTDFNFVATNATTLTNTATIDAGNTNPNSTVELTAQAGGLNVAAAIGNTTTPVGTVSLTSHDNLLSSNITGAVDATNLSLTSTTGGIGGSNLTTAFATNVANITANAATSAFISDSAAGTVTINGPSSAGTDFNFVATNATTLTNTASIDANNTNANATVELTSQAGGLDVAAAIGNTTTPVGTVSLTSKTNLLSSNITGAVDATNLSLTSTTGGIGGTNLTTPFATSVANIT